MTSINLKKAQSQKAAKEKTQEEIDKEIRKAAKGNEEDWVRKSIAIDKDIIEAMQEVAKKERKNFSQLTREFLLAGLKTRGVEL
jgi:hypothetical protein